MLGACGAALVGASVTPSTVALRVVVTAAVHPFRVSKISKINKLGKFK